MASVPAAARRLWRPGTLAILALGLAWGFSIHNLGWGQTAHFAQVQALADGDAQIDLYHWETGDKAWIDGHFYSVKSPGLPAISAPVLLLMREVGMVEWADRVSQRTNEASMPRWQYKPYSPYESFGYSLQRAVNYQEHYRRNTPLVWPLTLLFAVIPAVLLLFGVRWLADRLVPGYGAAAAVTLGVCTIVMTFAAEYFAHVISAGLGFAAFLVLYRERQREPSLLPVAGAGLLAGLAFSFEYQTALAAVIIGLYAIARAGWLRRGLAYGGAALVGTLPALAFNWWALGSPLTFAYGDAVAIMGFSGHDVLGLNDAGFFGITAPKLSSAFELLFAYRGLITLTPVVVMGVVGIFLLHRSGKRPEALLIGGIVAAYFVYNAGYWLPFGGGSPGPRFLIPALPFLGVALAAAWKRFGALTLALAIPSGVCMVVVALTYPLIGELGTDMWVKRFLDGEFEHTVFLLLGVDSNRLAVVPILLAVLAAAWLAARATPRIPIGAGAWKLYAVVVAWFGLAAVGPTLAEDDFPTLSAGHYDGLWLLGVAALGSLVTIAFLRWREARAADPGEPQPSAPVTAGERPGTAALPEPSASASAVSS